VPTMINRASHSVYHANHLPQRNYAIEFPFELRFWMTHKGNFLTGKLTLEYNILHSQFIANVVYFSSTLRHVDEFAMRNF